MQKIKFKELEHFGQAVRHHRLTRELSQEQLAHVCELDRTYIGGIERGERNVSLINIWKIANALRIKPAVLFSEAAE